MWQCIVNAKAIRIRNTIAFDRPDCDRYCAEYNFSNYYYYYAQNIFPSSIEW